MTELSLSSLALGSEVGQGGQGRVVAILDDPDRVVKIYHDPSLIDGGALQALIDARRSIHVNGRDPSHWASWPLARVVDSGRTVGFTMPIAPPSCVRIIAGRPRPADLSFLAQQSRPMWGPVALPDTAERLEILSALAGSMAGLHRQGVVLGDVSFANILWRLDPLPGIFLLDCDGFRSESYHRSAGLPAPVAVDTPDWDDPLAVPGAPATADSDNYKLSVAVVRVLSRSLTARPQGGLPLLPDLPDAQGRRISDLLERTVTSPSGSRPPAAEWCRALSVRRSVVVAPVTPRTIQAPPPKPQLLQPGGGPRRTRPVVHVAAGARVDASRCVPQAQGLDPRDATEPDDLSRITRNSSPGPYPAAPDAGGGSP